MGQGYSGVGGTVLSGAVDMEVEGFSFDLDQNDDDTTVTSDLGWEDSIHTTKRLSGSFDFLMQASKNPFGAVAGMIAPNYPTLTFALGGGQTASGVAIIGKISIKSATKTAIRCTASFKSKGAWSLPS